MNIYSLKMNHLISQKQKEIELKTPTRSQEEKMGPENGQ
jgi:hypothetical protein